MYKKPDTNRCFAKLRAISNLFSFFLYTLYNDSCKINHCDVNKIPYHRGMVMASLDINSLIAHIDELRVYINIIINRHNVYK